VGPTPGRDDLENRELLFLAGIQTLDRPTP
jgi:hypothetical protein